MSVVEPHVWQAIHERIEGGQQDAFMIVDIADVESKVAAWKRLLPRVEPLYAVKCHDDERVIKRLVELGVGFDCASLGEMSKVLAQGARPEDIIYAHPCKPASHVEYASSVGVNFMTFDNHDELVKVKRLHPTAKMLLRLLPDDSSAKCQLGVKFGADIDAVPSLLQTAKDLGVEVVGVSYHVGSGCQDISAFSEAVHLARRAFDVAAAMGMDFSVLDIGGGFPGGAVRHWKQQPTDGDDGEETAPEDADDDAEAEAHGDARTFPDIAQQLRPTLDQLFPEEEGVRIIAEPGRYMVHSSCVLVTNIIGRRRTAAPVADDSDDFCSDGDSLPGTKASPRVQETIRYYINDGVYGSFNNIIYDHASPTGFPLRIVSSSRSRVVFDARDDGQALADPDDDAQRLLSSGDEEQSDPEEAAAAADREVRRESSVWGPTCDGLDCVLKKAQLPLLEVGDWMYFPDMGAYTVAAAAAFNGFEVSKKYYI